MPSWKTPRKLQFQSISSGQHFLFLLQEKHYQLTTKAREALSHPCFLDIAPGEVDVVLVEMQELGLVCGTPYNQILAQALKCGLKYCLPEDGPQLRLDYDDQPIGEHVFMGMPPLVLWGQTPKIFVVDRLYGRYLSADDINPITVFHPGKQKLCFRL